VAAPVILLLVAIGGFDLWSSAQLVGAILFTLPLALCALQSSLWLLWGAASAAAALTVAAELWGFDRTGLTDLWVASVNRGLLLASLLALTLFVHFRITALRDLDRQKSTLGTRNARLEDLVVAATRDLTVQEQVGRRLAQMESRYRGLMEAAPDGMVVVNQGGQIVLANAQAKRQFGYGGDELLGEQVTTIIPTGFSERLIADGTRTAAEALGQHIGTGIELVARRKDGGQFPIEIMLSPLASTDGILVTAAIRDISVRKDAEKRLAEMEGRRRAMEEALRESEESYRLLIDGIQDHAIFMMDPRGQIVSWNAGAERIKGYRADEIIGRNFSCFFPPEDIERGRPEQVLRITIASGRHEEQGLRVRKDGSRFLANSIFTALRDASGTLRGFSEFSHDLSESKEAGAKYRGLLEAAPDAMVVLRPAGEIVLLNLQAEKQFGYQRDELVGQPVKNIIPEGFAERLIADGTRSAAEALAQQIGTGIELVGRRKDGSEFPIEIMLSPLESAEGILVTAAVRNISVRKEAERHLAQMEGRYRGLLEAAPDAMVLVNEGAEIVLVNAQASQQFRYERDELLGRQVKTIIPEGFTELVGEALRAAGASSEGHLQAGVELTGRRKDGSDFPIEIMLSPLSSAEGLLATVAIRDITRRKKDEAVLLRTMKELNRSNEELGQFAYIASHDLQEPLRMVASYTQLLSKRYKGRLDADADEFIAFAVDGANRMQRLIQDLLTYSRIGTKGRELLEVSSEEALARAVGNLQGAIDDSAAQVTHDPLPPVQADSGQLVQLFQNLVGNAIKYHGPGVIPRIHVSSTRKGDAGWDFSVKDNGLGIEEKYFGKIFGMFQRLHKREEFAGTGIGLAICKKIVERHGGSISVESRPGAGSTFHFTLTGSEAS
jgi:PAS domain S-box-containing protein